MTVCLPLKSSKWMKNTLEPCKPLQVLQAENSWTNRGRSVPAISTPELRSRQSISGKN